jgi:hypothetical protein
MHTVTYPDNVTIKKKKYLCIHINHQEKHKILHLFTPQVEKNDH